MISPHPKKFRFLGMAPAVLLFCAAPPASAADLAWERTSLEIRAEPGQRVANFHFPFRNTGRRAVTLVSVEASCRCLAVDVSRMTCGPGDKGDVLVAFSVGSTQATQEKSVTVTTDEPGAGPVRLVLRVAPSAAGK
jgi:hypothetical protein